MSADGPIFLLGSARSGTTMFRLMLACHPRIGVPPEGGWVVRLGWAYDRHDQLDESLVRSFVADLFLLDTTSDWELDRQELEARLVALAPLSYPALVDAVYRMYLERKFASKPRWGDKTTWYLDYLEQIDRYFPDARYVHLVRDGRAVVASFRKVSHLPSRVEDAAHRWMWSVRRIRDFGETVPGRYLEIHYERLVADPATTLAEVCCFLDEEYAPEMLDFARENRVRGLEPARHLDWKGMTLQQIDPAQADRWRSELQPDDLARFWAIAGPTMERFGYGRERSGLPATESVRLRLTTARYEGMRLLRRRLRPVRHRLRAVLAAWSRA